MSRLIKYNRRKFVKLGGLWVTGIVGFPYIVRAQAADHLYCGPSATGNSSGSDFNNLMVLPTTTGFIRGKTYVCIKGSYGSKTLSTAPSGSTFVTIRFVDPILDSTVPGYDSTLHNAPSIFSDIIVNTPRWIVNGVTRTETFRMEAPAGYGFRCTGTIRASSIDGDDASFSQFSYIDGGGTWSEATTPNCGSVVVQALYFVFNQHDITFTSCCFHNAGAPNGAIAMMHGSQNITFDHCDFYQGWGKATIASPNVQMDGLTVKFCRFWDSSRNDQTCGTEGGGITCEIGVYGNDLNPSNNIFYGNVFYGTASGNRNACLDFGGSGFSNSIATGHKAFNNTFVGFPESSVLSDIYFFGGSGNESGNNLFYNTGSATSTANSVFSNTDSASDIFVDYANRDFRLASDTPVWTTLGSPYNIDPLGNARTSSRGAYQFNGSVPGSSLGNKNRLEGKSIYNGKVLIGN